MTLHEVLDLIRAKTGREPKPNGRGHMCLCPAHADHDPSLEVWRQENGWLELKCYAHCDRGAILAALGITNKDLGPDKPVRDKREIAKTYDYHDADGNVVFQAVRYVPKQFAQRRPSGNGGWVWGLSAGEYVQGVDGDWYRAKAESKGTRRKFGTVKRQLYHLPEVLEAVRENKFIFLTEGEKDTDRLRELGFKATTAAGGAKSRWEPQYTRALAEARVIILPDNDAAGRECTQKLLRELPNAAVLELPGLPPAGDVSDWLENGGTPTELRRLTREAWDKPRPAPEPDQAAPCEFGDPLVVETTLCTDVQAATRFAEMAGGAVRWVPEFGWLVWDSTRWRRDAAGVVFALAEGVGQKFRELAPQYRNPEAARVLFKWARTCESSRGIANFLQLAQHRLAREVEQFDTDPLVLNTPAGTLSFQGADMPRVRPHAQTDNLTKCTVAAWEPDAAAPRWCAFLEEILPNPDVRAFVRRAAGYSLLGTTREQCFFLCHGSGCNGKSTFLSVLLKVIGPDYALQCAAETFMQQRSDRIRADLARLRGIRFVSAIETSENRRLDEAMVKAMTGGDALVAEHKYKEPFQFFPEFKFWLATNHRPRIHDASHAMWRRVRLIPFEVTIPEDRRDPDLEAKLLEEAPGILAWLAAGAAEYLLSGLKAPAAVTAATDEYRNEEDVLGKFLEDVCVVAPTARVSKRDLHETYTKWCEDNGEKPLSQGVFSRKIAGKGFDQYREHPGTRFWIGVGLGVNT